MCGVRGREEGAGKKVWQRQVGKVGEREVGRRGSENRIGLERGDMLNTMIFALGVW